MMTPARSLLLAATWTVLLLVGCGPADAPDLPSAPYVAPFSVSVTPRAFNLRPGARIQLKAQVFDANGEMVFNRTDLPVVVRWSSSDPDVAEVDDDGLVTVHRDAAARITAELDEDSTKTLTAASKKKKKKSDSDEDSDAPAVGDTDAGGTDAGGTDAGGTDASVPLPSDAVTINGADAPEAFSDVQAIFVSPRRITIDINRPRKLSVSAVDAQGAPTTLDCGEDGPTLDFGDAVRATYTDQLGAESIDVTGLKKGFTVLTFECGGYFADPIVIEVKPSVTIPDASPSSSGSDFGQEPSLALDGERIHLTTYDAANGKLVYTRFDGVWTSQFIDGEGDYGRQSQVVLDPANEGRPLVCALEGELLTCWLQDAEGYWSRRVVDVVKAGETYETEITVKVAHDGRIFALYHRQSDDALVLATSWDASRDMWDQEVVTFGADHSAMALASDGSPRIAFRQDNAARYGHKGCWGMAGWMFEDIDRQDVAPSAEEADDEDAPTPPGTYIRLALGVHDRPHVVYYKGGNLVHAIKSNADWRTDVIEAVTLGGTSIGFALDHRMQPRVSYYDDDARLMRYASRRNQRWHIDSPTAEQGIGAQSVLTVDAYNRAQIAYYDGRSKEAGFYVEPHFLDYTPFEDPVPFIENSYVNACGY